MADFDHERRKDQLVRDKEVKGIADYLREAVVNDVTSGVKTKNPEAIHSQQASIDVGEIDTAPRDARAQTDRASDDAGEAPDEAPDNATAEAEGGEDEDAES